MFNRLGIILLCLLVVKSVWAVSVSFSGVSEVVNYDQEIVLDVFLTCSSCGDSYLRGVLTEVAESHQYFGYTKNNGGEWIESENDRTKYFRVGKDELREGSWSGKLVIKSDDKHGSGRYYLKVGRYTGSGGSSAFWSDTIAINLVGQQPTVTNTPRPASATVTTKPTAVPTTVTKATTVTKSHTNTPINTITLTSSQNIEPVNESVIPSIVTASRNSATESHKLATNTSELRVNPEQVLGVNVATNSSVNQVSDMANVGLKRSLAIGLLLMGLVSAIGGAGMFWYKYNKKVINL